MCLPRTQHGHLKGFTLIELLVVVALIMIVATMLMPALFGAGHAARRARCLSNEMQVVKGVVSYALNYNGFIPSPAYSNTQPEDSVDDSTYYRGDRTEIAGPDGTKLFEYKSHNWRGKVLPFVATVTGLKGAFIGKGDFYEPADKSEWDRLYGIFYCTVIYNPPPFSAVGYQLYGMNGYMAMFTNPQRLRDPSMPGGVAAGHIDTVADATNTLFIGDNWDSHWAVKPKYPRTATDFTKVGEVYAGQVMPRHVVGGTRKVNFAYFDGHADGLTMKYKDSDLGMDQVHQRECYLWLPEKPEVVTK